MSSPTDDEIFSLVSPFDGGPQRIMTNMPINAIVEVSESPSEAYTPIDSNLAGDDLSPDLRPTIFAQLPTFDS